MKFLILLILPLSVFAQAPKDKRAIEIAKQLDVFGKTASSWCTAQGYSAARASICQEEIEKKINAKFTNALEKILQDKVEKAQDKADADHTP